MMYRLHCMRVAHPKLEWPGHSSSSWFLCQCLNRLLLNWLAPITFLVLYFSVCVCVGGGGGGGGVEFQTMLLHT